MSDINADINNRWENGIEHHPESKELFKSLAEIDMKYGNDYFCWKSGGEGDNGEHLMYEMDIYFEQKDKIYKLKDVISEYTSQEVGGDWTEDLTHENGNYENTCSNFGKNFIGHKRRVICKARDNQTNELEDK